MNTMCISFEQNPCEIYMVNFYLGHLDNTVLYDILLPVSVAHHCIQLPRFLGMFV